MKLLTGSVSETKKPGGSHLCPFSSKVILGSQVSVGEYGVFFTHGAETFDCDDKFLIFHEL